MNTAEINYNEEMNKLVDLATQLFEQIEYVNELRAFAEEKLRYQDLKIQDFFHIKEALKLDAPEQSVANKKISDARDARRDTKNGADKHKQAKPMLDALYEPLKKIMQNKLLNEEKVVVYVPRTEEGVEFLNEIKDYENRTKKNIKVVIKDELLEKPEKEFERKKEKEKTKILELPKKEEKEGGQGEIEVNEVQKKKSRNRRNRRTNKNKDVKLEVRGSEYTIVRGEERIVFQKYSQMLTYAKQHNLVFAYADGVASKRMAQIFRETQKKMNLREKDGFKKMFGIVEN